MGHGRAGGGPERSTHADADLLREQVDDIKVQLTHLVRRAGRGSVLVGAAGVCGLLTVLTAHEAALRTLESVVPRPWAAVGLATAYGAAAAALAAHGRARLRQVADVTGEAIEQVRHELAQGG